MTMRSCDELTIRILSEEDVELFWPLRLQALQNEPQSFGSDYDEARTMPLSDVKKRLDCSENSFVLGAFCPDLVGVAGFFRKQGVKSRHKGTIWGVYVDPSYRGRGISRELMKTAIDRARQIPDLESLILTVVTTNQAALNLYQSLGFTEYGLESQALKLNGSYLDEVLMEFKLTG